MATPFPIPVTAAQVGTYFVGQYYRVLQQQPDYVHRFYSDASTMLRIDGNTRDTATDMMQIHQLIMSLNFTGYEVKTAHSLESWNGGVLVMVSGSVQVKDFIERRKFMQTFFLAPQEKGFFVLNDIFHIIEEEPIHHHPAVFLAQSNFDSKHNAVIIPEPGSNYLTSGEIQARDYVAPADVKENGLVDSYGFHEQQLQPLAESENILEDNSAEEFNGSLQNTVNAVQDHLPASVTPVEEPIGETQKHTYASILRVAKGQSALSVASQPTVNKNLQPSSDWNHVPEPTIQHSTVFSNAYEKSGAETVEVSAVEDDEEIKSVYVRNLPPNVSESEIAEEFKKFGELSSEGVVIRSRKDVGVCYAFVEFEDISGVHNAVKVGSALVAGRQVYIEERRSNSNIPSRGGRRGRGRGSYTIDAPRGRFVSRSYGRGGGYDGVDREYNRPRGNGVYRPGHRQERGFSGHEVLRSGQNLSE